MCDILCTVSDPPRGTFLVTNWPLTTSLWSFFLPFPSLPTLYCFKRSIQSNDQSDLFWPLPVQLGCKSLEVHSMPKQWTQNSSPPTSDWNFCSCIKVTLCVCGFQVLWQTLFNFKEVREKLRRQGHSCTETSKDTSQNIYAVALAKEMIIKKVLLYIVPTCTSISVWLFFSWIKLRALLQELWTSYKLCNAELSGTALLIFPAVAPDDREGLLLEELWTPMYMTSVNSP